MREANTLYSSSEGTRLSRRQKDFMAVYRGDRLMEVCSDNADPQ